MSTNPEFSQNSPNSTTQNLLVLSGAACGSIIVLITIACLCDRFFRCRPYQNTNNSAINPNPGNKPNGLDPSIVASLPTFRYKSEQEDICGAGNLLECVVCLSMVQEGEEVRRLLICKHLFHRECIDMWFCSHSTCPICRSLVQATKEEKVVDRGTMTTSSPVMQA